jgi:formate C-acetyltransferase
VFVSDALVRKALMRAGVDAEAARLCDIKGCYEYAVQGGMDCVMNYLNLMKPLEYALHEGRDGVTGEFALRKCPAPSKYGTFDELYAEYKAQLTAVIDGILEIVNGFEDYLAYMNPQSMLSATYPTCIERGRDALAGGATASGSGLMCGFIADLADSLAMIKKYVFDKKDVDEFFV